MKINKLQYIGLLLCWMMLLPGCSEKELDNYAGPESIYFDLESLQYDFSFLKYPGNFKDTTFLIKVCALGEAKSYDRAFQLEVVDSSTLVLGTHFEMELNQVMPQGQLSFDVPVKVLRHMDLQDETKKHVLYLRLKVNEYFNLNLHSRYLREGTYNLLQCVLAVDDQLKRPAQWTDENLNSYYYRYFGKYSKKKFMLIMEVSQRPADFFAYDGGNGFVLLAVARVVNQYLAMQDPKILDEDGSIMTMGDEAP